MTSTKHFLGYEQETHRLATTNTPWAEPVSANMDDKTMHELYLWYSRTQHLFFFWRGGVDTVC